MTILASVSYTMHIATAEDLLYSLKSRTGVRQYHGSGD
jgi:hypothetical protein